MRHFGFKELIWDQYTKVPPVLTADLNDKTVLVVGANAGIGLEAAKHFARMGLARVILACRSEERGQKAAELIAKEINFKADVELLDLSSFESVTALAKRLNGEPIDILVANAAVALPEYVPTKDGWEQSLQVNHLSTALLSFLLVPNLLKAAELHALTSRLVIVCSEVHHMATWEPELLQSDIVAKLGSKEYCTTANMGRRYPDTKLLNVLYTRAFAHHLSPHALVTTTVNLGLCATDLPRNAPIGQRMCIRVLQTLLARTAEQGARQLLWASLGPDGQQGPHVRPTMNGAYVSIAEVRKPSNFVTSKEGWEVQEKVWYETIDILAKVVPSVSTIVQQYFGN
ncbi:short-chain dehydrogenase [Cytidiella melzeri]|nr:short-chain dehydrogenase [Cytidiella melzeri]